MSNTQVTYEIKTKIGVIAEHENGWKKELNKVSWNDNEPKYDIREWNEDHTKMSRGITLYEEELKVLQYLLNKLFPEVTE